MPTHEHATRSSSAEQFAHVHDTLSVTLSDMRAL